MIVQVKCMYSLILRVTFFDWFSSISNHSNVNFILVKVWENLKSVERLVSRLLFPQPVFFFQTYNFCFCNSIENHTLCVRVLYLLNIILSAMTKCLLKMNYLQVNAISEWIIGIYLHEFININSAASCGIENFEFIVSERVQVNPDNSRAMSALTILLFKLNTLQSKIVKLWVSRSHGAMTVVYWIYTTAITPL